ncbi:MAG: DUF5320 domain-containing protein [Clostridia bacterium]
MPRRDGTGPMGAGSMTGRRLGTCANPDKAGNGAGLGQGLGRGPRRGAFVNQTSSKTQKELLKEQKEALKNRIDVIDKQLED